MSYRWIVSLFAGAGIATGVFSALPSEPPRTLNAAVQPAAEKPAEVKEQIAFARTLSDAFNHAAKVIGPSVVHVTQMNRVLVRRSFFDPGEARIQPTGLGSGIIISADGYILTNNHVIAGAQSLRVKLSDGREYDAAMVGTDPASDLAVLKIDAGGLTAAKFADSDGLQVGEWVVAVGSPFGFDNTVTAGIVSATGRVGLQGQTDERYEEFIQTDAAINPGNSGGPLVNLEGSIVGINDQIATRNGGSVGLGFAIPSTIAQPVADALIRNGRVERGWAGIVMTEARPEDAARGTRGVLINSVVDGGPAEQAGIKAGDLVTRFNSRPVWNTNRLKNTIAFTPPGSTVPVDLVRDGQKMTVSISLTDNVTGQAAVNGARAFRALGMAARTLDAETAGNIDYPRELQPVGVVVTQIDPGGPADTGDMHVQDVIVQVNGANVRSVEEFDQAVKGAPPGRAIRFGVVTYRQAGFGMGWQQGWLEVTPRG
ncbi:MAG: trypsin-like peptidase domain-containing protein [Phycisphaerales bacterium]|nr:trypsin-like peptidase domain-containing protein [Phycisphaerales bacterium]